MNISFKQNQQEFSTTDFQQSRASSYLSRFQKSKNKKNKITNLPIKDRQLFAYLPFHIQKAAIIIQRYWRQRMSNRRKFYQGLYQELVYDNQAMQSMAQTLQNQIAAAKKQIKNLQKMDSLKVDQSTKQNKHKMKSLAKQCVTLAFKLQKQMLTQFQLNNLLKQRALAEQRIFNMKKIKADLQNQLIKNSNQTQQIILRQIRQANSQLLKIVSQKNSLKQKIKQQNIENDLFLDEYD